MGRPHASSVSMLESASKPVKRTDSLADYLEAVGASVWDLAAALDQVNERDTRPELIKQGEQSLQDAVGLHRRVTEMRSAVKMLQSGLSHLDGEKDGG